GDAPPKTDPLPSVRQRRISIVVVAYDIPRELPRTLLSLSAEYQRHVDADDYEVIVVDNGSTPALGPDVWEGLAGRFRLVRLDPASPSPATAINRGLAEAEGDVIGVMIDGARIATPGLIHFGYQGARLYDRAVVSTLGWHLGFDYQSYAVRAGYDSDREDRLLQAIEWPKDGYRLFEIATLDESSIGSGLLPLSESNAIFMRREVWEELDGVDERFNEPGGGFLNLDTYRRALELPDAELVILLGEGTFHQLHGGVATNAPPERLTEMMSGWASQYEAIHGRPFRTVPWRKPPTLLGTLPRPALAAFVQNAMDQVSPLGRDFDRSIWSLEPPGRPADPTVAALVDLAHGELRARRYDAAAAVARIARARAPDEPEPQRLLSVVAPWLDLRAGHPEGFTPDRRARHHFAVGEAHRLLGELDAAAGEYRAALRLNPNLAEAHLALDRLKRPGPIYYLWLDQLHVKLRPRTVVEIGIGDGASLARVRPFSLAIGIDPSATIAYPLQAETRIFPETSDEFFARRKLDEILGGRPVDFALIDGLHLYEQVLRDFINLERYCNPKSVIAIHDTIPLDEATQSRARDTQFHTGDVWKAVLCLKAFRPDLEILTIATPPTGLTLVMRLDPGSRVLAEAYDEAVARFVDMPYAELEGRETELLNIVPNEWAPVEERLTGVGLLRRS
ncbi:MAG TPA: glycosyltransferase, partial [Microvirga sp.]|nr:glycosyltransferase [Microvirga sp.]